MKLIMQTVPVSEKCKLCQKIDTKWRRRVAEVDRINRWQREGNKFRASIDKSMEIIRGLDAEIYELGCERNRRLQGIGSHSWLDTEISAPDPDQLKARIIPKASTRKGLPITFEMGGSQATVMSSPDSGSEENAISQELALKLGLKIEKYEERAFRMANGKVVRCCGRTISACGFGTESHLGYLSLLCRFYVFKTLASPLIMCMGFLEKTQTLTKHRNRLVNLTLSPPPLLRVRAIGKPKKRLLCSLDGVEVQAIADSGSEVDLVSETYARKRGFTTARKEMNIMFADGSIGQTRGVIHAQLCIGTSGIKLGIISDDEALNGDFLPAQPADGGAKSGLTFSGASKSVEKADNSGRYCNVLKVEFYVLKDLVSDVLIGEDSLESLNVFTQHLDDLKYSDSEILETPEVHRIVLLGPMEQRISRSKTRVNRWMARAFGLKDPTGSDNKPLVSPQQRLSERDQRENSRREKERQRWETLSVEARRRAMAEEETRQKLYDDDRALVLQALGTTRHL